MSLPVPLGMDCSDKCEYPYPRTYTIEINLGYFLTHTCEVPDTEANRKALTGAITIFLLRIGMDPEGHGLKRESPPLPRETKQNEM